MNETEIREPENPADASKTEISSNEVKESESRPAANANWSAWQVYAMAAVCLLVGLLFGYLVRGSAPASTTAVVTGVDGIHTAVQPQAKAQQQMPSLDDMKRMADKQAEPLLEKLKSDPNNADVLNQLGTIYRATHQFQIAADYYKKSLDANPKNVGPRTDLASCLYYQGDVDGAIAQLEKSLRYDPKHAGTLLNLGLIRWKGKGDASGAVKAWETLLKYHPDFPNKAGVEQLIAEAKNHAGKGLPQSE